MTRRIPAQDRLLAPAGTVAFVDDLAAAEGKAGAGSKRFRMTAYTGALMRRWYGDLVIELAGLEIGSERKPILLEHSREQRAGFSESVKKDRTLEIEGKLLSNEFGASIARDSAEGFPFQASIGVQFESVEDVADGHTRTVNGSEVKGPCYVATRSKLLESSFVCLGADGNTSAESFSRQQGEIEVSMSDQTTTPPAAPAAQAPKGATLTELKAAFPGRPDFVIEQAEKSATLEQARGAFSDVLARENAELRGQIEKLAKAGPKQVQVVPFHAGAREAAGGALVDEKAALEGLEPSARAAAEFKVDPAIRKEFGDEKTYAAFLAADAKGSVRVFEKAPA